MSDAQEQTIAYRPIGVIRSPHTDPKATPIQPVYADQAEGRAEIRPEYADGLRDLEGFSHLWLIYWFHQAPASRLVVKP